MNDGFNGTGFSKAKTDGLVFYNRIAFCLNPRFLPKLK